MARPYSDEEQLIILKRRERVQDALLREESIPEIARREKVTPYVIRSDAAWILKQERENVLGRTENLVLQEMLKLSNDEHKLRKKWDNLPVEEGTETWLKVYDRILRVMERRAKMMGLDAPEETRIDAVAAAKLVAQVVRAIIDTVTNEQEGRAVVMRLDEILVRMGLGTCLPEPGEYTESDVRVKEHKHGHD